MSALRSRFPSLLDTLGTCDVCRVLTEHDIQIAPSSYYAHRQQPVTDALRAEASLVNVVIDLHRKNRNVYGIRKIWHKMTQAGHHVGRDQVARLMAIAGVHAVSRGQHTTTTTRPGRGEGHSRAADLIGRDWTAPTRPDQWWVADFRTCGRAPGSATSRSSWMSIPGVFWGGGCRCPRRPRW